MKNMNIREYQAKHIEDTFRIIANTHNSRSKETCLDRMIMTSIKFINQVLSTKSEEPDMEFTIGY